jgi:single-stranded DNA-binding protein
LRCLASSGARKGDFVGNDAELKSTKNETAVAVFSVATQRSWKNDRGGYDSRTEWHRCLAWGKLSKFASALKKGAHVQVEGELRYREYERITAPERIACRSRTVLPRSASPPFSSSTEPRSRTNRLRELPARNSPPTNLPLNLRPLGLSPSGLRPFLWLALGGFARRMTKGVPFSNRLRNDDTWPSSSTGKRPSVSTSQRLPKI